MDKSIALTLGKLLVAIAWADGELQDEEVQVLKDLIYKIPDLTREDWASIEVYLDEPVTPKECRTIMEQFKELISSEEDKAFAVRAFRDIIYADGEVTDDERKLYEILVDEIQNTSSGFEKKLENFFTGARKSRESMLHHIPRRERNIDDFVENPIFFRSLQTLTRKGIVVHMDKSELESLCVSGAIMACVAQADGKIHPNEISSIKEILKEGWKLNEEAADIVTEIAVHHDVVGMDLLRMCRKFFSEHDNKSRLDFYKVLIEVAKSDLDIDASELERLRSIATNLKIPTETMLELLPKLGDVDPKDLQKAKKQRADNAVAQKNEQQNEDEGRSNGGFADI